MTHKIEPVRVALIGAGAISSAYSLALEAMDQMNLVGVADVNPQAASDLAEKHNCASFECFEKMCDETKPEAVIVCTPPATHREIAVSLMDRSIHVLCEKPLATTPEDAWTMIRAAQSNEVIFTMASKFRFVPDVAKTRELLSEGILGDIILFENSFTGVVDMSTRWNSDPALSGGGVLIDNGTHSVDIMRFLLGPLSEIRAVEGKRLQSMNVEDTVHIFVKSVEGVVGSIDLSWSLSKGLPNFINIFGSNGTLHVGWRESKYKLNGDDDWTVFGTGYDKVAAFRNQLVNFAGAIRGIEPLVIGPADAIASVYTIEAAYQAMNSNDWLPVTLSDKIYEETK